MQQEGVDGVEQRQADGHQSEDVDETGNDVLETNNMVSTHNNNNYSMNVIIV